MQRTRYDYDERGFASDSLLRGCKHAQDAARPNGSDYGRQQAHRPRDGARSGGAGRQHRTSLQPLGGDAQQLAAELEREGVKTWTVRADFRQPEEYQSLVNR